MGVSRLEALMAALAADTTLQPLLGLTWCIECCFPLPTPTVTCQVERALNERWSRREQLLYCHQLSQLVELTCFWQHDLPIHWWEAHHVFLAQVIVLLSLLEGRICRHPSLARNCTPGTGALQPGNCYLHIWRCCQHTRLTGMPLVPAHSSSSSGSALHINEAVLVSPVNNSNNNVFFPTA